MPKVLFLPSGSGMAVMGIKLLNPYHETVGADSWDLAPGLYLANSGYIIPKFSSTEFWTKIKELIEKEKPHYLFPCHDAFLLMASAREDWFNSLGVKVIVSPIETISICRDKLRTFEVLGKLVEMPKTTIHSDIAQEWGFPFFGKPRFGSGSQNILKITNKLDLEYYLSKEKEPLFQELLPGIEYSVDCLASKNGQLLVAIPRIRIEIKAGIATKAEVVNDKRLIEMAKILVEKMHLRGPFVFQAKEDDKGIPNLIECNPRLGGAMCTPSKSMINIPLAAIQDYEGISIQTPEVLESQFMIRYLEEVYLDTSDINQIYNLTKS